MNIKTLFLVLLALMLTACNTNVIIDTSKDNVASAVAGIADFDLPTGYYADFSATVMGYVVVAYASGDGPGHIYLIQSEHESDGEKLAQVLDQIVIGSGDPKTHVMVIETSSVMVRGQETTLVVSDVVNSEGLAYKQAAVGFQGNGGPALLVFSESIENWDENILNALLASIH